MKDKRILSIIDRVLQDWLSRVDEVFSDEKLTKKLIFSKTSNMSRFMRTPRQCIYPECTHDSIIHSHTIQRSGPLSEVAEDGHVLTPEFNNVIGELELNLVGVKKYASTFPGFCAEHERLFSEFENKKKLDDPKDIALQIYRTLSREIVIRQLQIENINKAVEEYRAEEYKQYCEFLDIELARNGLDIRHKDLKFELKGEDKRTLFYKRLSKHLEKVLKDVEELARLSFEEITVGGEKLVYRVIEIDSQIPVCMAGISSVTQSIRSKKRWKKHRGRTRNIYYIVNVLPSPESTQIILCVKKQFEEELNKYVKFCTQTSFHILSAIESWMIYGTDHWFIQPSIFNKIPHIRQTQIVNDLHKFGNIYMPYNLSVFDDIRQSLLDNYINLNEYERGLLEEVYRMESKKMILEQNQEKYGLRDFYNLISHVKL